MVGDHAAGPTPFPGVLLEPRLKVPVDLPGWVMNPSLLRAFNSVFYWHQARQTRPFLTSPDAFFYPLDSIANWNRLYGRQGFIQYQCVLPEEEAFAGVQLLLERISAAGAASFLAVLKRLGGGSEGLLSFCMPGFTLALDIPFKGAETLALVQSLDREVVSRGGRVNLCKDACLSPETFRAMYPGLAAWREIKHRLDPGGLIQSELSRRLHLLEEV
jgi:FAD/FMN-containing dehydrogenase